jgi:putative ABC transport system permease protein
MKTVDQSINHTLWRRIAWPHHSQLIALSCYIALGIFTIFAMAQLTQSVQNSLRQQAQQLMGSDVKLTSWQPFTGTWYEQSNAYLLPQFNHIQSIQTSTMVHAVDHKDPPFLVSLKAVEEAYPLRGKIKLHTSQTKTLKTGEIWIHQQLAQQRQLQIGQKLKIGRHDFVISNFIIEEPDAGLAGALSFAPRVMMRYQDFKNLPLLQFGSRIQRQWQITIPSGAQQQSQIKTLIQQLQETIPDHVNLQSYLQAQPNTAQIFERVGLFFSMIALLTLGLCLLALLHGFWDMLFQQLPIMSHLQNLGVSVSHLRRFYLQQALLIGAIGGALGVAVGLLLAQALQVYATHWLPFELTFYTSYTHIGLTWLTSILVSWVINLFLQRALARLSLHDLHRTHNPNLTLTLLERAILLLLVVMGVLIYLWYNTGSLFIAIVFIVGILILYILYSLLIYLGFKFYQAYLYSKRHQAGAARNFALRMLLAKRKANTMLILNLSLGFTFLMSIQQIHHNLIQVLSIESNTNAPIFMFDVQSDQTQELKKIVTPFASEDVELLPITRARLSALKGQKILAQKEQANTQQNMQQRRQARTLYREYSLTSRASLGAYETLHEGQWWSEKQAQNPNFMAISLEERLAQRLGVNVGDTLTLDIQGIELTLEVWNIRRVNWLSLRPNFLMILPPGLLANAPKTWIAGLPIKAKKMAVLSRQVYQSFPNVSIVDLRPIFQEAKRLLNALDQALSISAYLCILAGAILFFLAIRRDAQHKHAYVQILHALGLNHRQANMWVRKEYYYISYLMGVMVAIGVLLMTYAANKVLKIPFDLDIISYLVALLILCIVAPIMGTLNQKDEFTTPKNNR